LASVKNLSLYTRPLSKNQITYQSPEFRRSHFIKPREGPGKMVAVAEPGLLGDVVDAEVGVLEQIACPLETLHLKIFFRRSFSFLFKEMDKRIRVHAEETGKVRVEQLLADVLFHILKNGEQSGIIHGGRLDIVGKRVQGLCDDEIGEERKTGAVRLPGMKKRYRFPDNGYYLFCYWQLIKARRQLSGSVADGKMDKEMVDIAFCSFVK
jgi:hypothetical protein